MKPKVSLIVACYNQAELVRNMFYSLQNQSFTDFEIVIADDGSGDELKNVILEFQKTFKFPIKHVRHDDNGFRKTIIVNEAVRKSSADYLLFIDGDCILHHKFIERHHKRREENVVLSGRRIMFDEVLSKRICKEDVILKKIQKPAFWWNHCNKRERKRGFYLPFLYKLLNNVTKDYWAFGSNFSLHRTDFYKVNGYDETIIGRGMEDINLSQRFKLIGFKTKRLTYEAIQYHQYHFSKPVPHNDKETEKIGNPEKYWVERGLEKNI